MRNYSCNGRRRLLIAPILAAVLYSSPAVCGEIFKCVAKDGSALYQNFPCNIESLGFLPSDAAKAKPAPLGAPPVQAKPTATAVPALAAAPVNVASTAQAADAALRTGMSSDEVRALWGEPEDVIEDEPGVGGPVSLWRYAGGKSVQFDHKHLVVGVQR